MKRTTKPQKTAIKPKDSRAGSSNTMDTTSHGSANGAFANRIFRQGNGKGLMKFCRELAVILIRRHSGGDDAGDLRVDLCASLQATLQCSKPQANSLIDLSLEIIHAKVHGTYRRSDTELSYLIAVATGAVVDVQAN